MAVIENLGNDVAEAPAAVTEKVILDPGDKNNAAAVKVVSNEDPKPTPVLQTIPAPIPSPKTPQEQAKVAVRPLHDFPLPYRNGVHVYRKDQIITDPLLVEYMLKHNCPVVKVEEKVDYQVCPKCFHHF
jgi:hypothetical protein